MKKQRPTWREKPPALVVPELFDGDGDLVDPEWLTKEKLEFIELQSQRLAAYTLESYDRLRAEGNMLLQWLFGLLVGGLGLAGTAFTSGYPTIACGVFAAACWGAYLVKLALPGLGFSKIQPPGNRVGAFAEMRADNVLRMRYREAIGVDQRQAANSAVVDRVAAHIERMRKGLIYAPLVMLLATALACFVWTLTPAAEWLRSWALAALDSMPLAGQAGMAALVCGTASAGFLIGLEKVLGWRRKALGESPKETVDSSLNAGTITDAVRSTTAATATDKAS